AERTSRKPARASATWPSTARTALATYSNGFLIFAPRASGAQNSGEARIVRSIALTSPSDRRNVAATRSTSAGGGSSATKRATTWAAVGPGLPREVRARAEPVVEIEERGRVGGRPAQQVAELAERVGADDIALVGGQVPLHLALGGLDVEVVEPEVDHDLLELALAFDGEHDPRRL